MIKLLDDSRIGSKPIYYALNTATKQHNFAFSHAEDLKNWLSDELKFNSETYSTIESGRIKDRTDLEVISVFTCGGDSKVNNQGKIL